jgi:hypothetical protein
MGQGTAGFALLPLPDYYYHLLIIITK